MISEAQKEAGNYAKTHIRVQGLDISIENRKGTIRRGKGWATVMPYDYGYIKRTMGADGDQVDVFVGGRHDSEFVVVVNQYRKDTGRFDEVKVGLGYMNLADVKAAYRKSYSGKYVPMAVFKPTTIHEFKRWLISGVSRLTGFESNMKARIVDFRAKEKEEGRSVAGKVAAGLGVAATLGGFYLYRRNSGEAMRHRARIAPHEAVLKGNATSWTGPMQGPKAPTSIPKATPPAAPSPATTPVTAPVAPAATAPVAAPVTRTGSHLHAPAADVPAGRKATIVVNKGTGSVRDIANMMRTKANRKGGRKMLAARIVLTNFQDRNRDGTLGVSTNPLSAYRKASRIVPWVNRAGQAAGDLGDMAAGKEVKKPFYKEGWFKRAVTTAAIATPILANSLARSGERKQADGIRPRPVHDTSIGAKIDRATHSAANIKRALKNKIGLGRIVRTVELANCTLVLREFAYENEGGFGLRDGRGNSVRVFAPNAKPRDRREKTWGEKTENIRLVRNAALVVAGAGALGTAYYARKAVIASRPKTHVPHKDIVDFPRKKALAARIVITEFKAGDPALRRINDSVMNNIEVVDPTGTIDGIKTAADVVQKPLAQRVLVRGAKIGIGGALGHAVGKHYGNQVAIRGKSLKSRGGRAGLIAGLAGGAFIP